MNTKPSVLKKIISAFNFQLSIKINGKKFKVPVILNMGFLNLKIKEDWFSNFIKSHPLPKDTVFVDVGVNVGQTLLTFRSCSNNFYFGFEPNPSCVFYLRSLISANKFSNVSFYKMDIDFLPEIADLYQVSNLPSFIAFESGAIFDSLVGADVDKLNKLITDLIQIP